MSNSGPYIRTWADHEPAFPSQFELDVIERVGFTPRSAVVGALIRDIQFYALVGDRLTHVNGLPISSLSTNEHGDIGHLIESADIHVASGFVSLDLTVWFGGRMLGMLVDEASTVTVAHRSPTGP